MIIRLALILLWCVSSQAASYFVSTNGNDSNSGLSGSPVLTITKGVSLVAAGDSLTVSNGTYAEFVVIPTSGTPGNPITITAESQSTIIDPSTVFTSGWVSAADIGFGMWKQTNMTFVCRFLSINNSNVAGIYTNGDITAQIGNVFAGSGLTTGTQCLAVASSSTFNRDGVACSFWNPLGALWVADTNTCYLRLRDGSEPNGLNIRINKNSNLHSTFQPRFDSAAIAMAGRSNVIIRGFTVRNAFSDIYMDGCRDNTIQSNYLGAAFNHVYMVNIGCSGNTIQGNTISGDYYAGEFGAWEGLTDSAHEDAHGVYVWGKYMMGESSTFENGVNLLLVGNTNLVKDNIIVGGIGGNAIGMLGDISNPTKGTVISGNYLANNPSVGYLSTLGQTYTTFASNYLENCNTQIRLHEYNTVGELNRTNLFYRNFSRLPNSVGDHLFFFFESSGGTYHPSDTFYHNSASGGRYGMDFNANAFTAGGVPNVRIINNAFSGATAYYSAPASFSTTPGMIKIFDYNLITPSSANTNGVPWVGTHTIRSANQWVNAKGLNFIPPLGSPLIDNALDTSSSWTYNAITYPALPDLVAKQGAAWDIGALEYQVFVGRVMRVTNLHINKAFP